MGFPTRKEFHRHLHWQHGVENPEAEETEDNLKLIKNPPWLTGTSFEEKRKILSTSRKKAGVHVPRKRKRNSKAMQKETQFKKLCSKIGLPNTE